MPIDVHAVAAPARSAPLAPSPLPAEGVDLTRLGPSIGIAVPARRLDRARVLWLNHRWFLSHGVDSCEPAVRSEIEASLLSDFAVQTIAGGSAPADASLTADRYGGTGGARHGGSGRCAFKGRYNAKGIGPTALVPGGIEPRHGDGRMSLVDAIKEALFAELAAMESPLGAVPVVAIIDSGKERSPGTEPDAIVVRPNFVRPAHFERSIFFGTSGTVGSDQFLDAARTREAIEAAERDLAKGECVLGFPGIEGMFEKFGRQLGHAQASRLWQGKFLTSNVTLEGSFVDFGSFRPVPSWRRCYGYPEAVFGTEPEFIGAAADSLAFHFAKYSQSRVTPAELKACAERSIEIGFRDAALQALNLPELEPAACDAIASELRAYFDGQQRHYVLLDEEATWRLPWLHAAYSEGAGTPPGPPEQCTRQRIDDIIRSVTPASDQGHALSHTALAMSAWLRPREEIDELVLFHMLGRLIASPDVIFGSGRSIGAFLAMLLSRNRRAWSCLPAGLVVTGYVTDGISHATYAVDTRTGTPTLLLEAPVIQGRCILFGSRVPLEDIGPHELGSVGARISRRLTARPLAQSLRIQFRRHSVRVPPPARPRAGMPAFSTRSRAIAQSEVMWWEEHVRRRSSYMRHERLSGA